MIKVRHFLLLLILILTGCKSKSASYEHLFIDNLKKTKFKNSQLTIEKEVREYKEFTSYIASYYSENLKQYALLDIPNTKKDKYPVIIVDHGHIPPEKYSTINSYVLVTTYYAQNGFLVLKPDYRGHDKSENVSDTQLNVLSYPVDVLNLLYALPSLEKADLSNIFLFGHSMGGPVTLTVLEAYPNIKAATLWAPVSVPFPESSLYFTRKRNKELAVNLENQFNNIFSKSDYYKLSTTNYLSLIKVPILLQHGNLDESVPYNWSEKLVEKFKENKINYQFYTYEDDHNFSKKYFYTALKRDVDFFKSFLK
jgi:uncharacterized protein